MALVGMAGRSNAGADLKAVRTGIGAAPQTLLSDVLREPIPDRMAELLKQLDQPSSQRSGDGGQDKPGGGDRV
jgi:hypothetical protein